MESCSDQKRVKQIKKRSIFRFFKVATLCLDDSFAQLCTLMAFSHEVGTWNAFQLTGVPC
jgi:hypothetical protein